MYDIRSLQDKIIYVTRRSKSTKTVCSFDANLCSFVKNQFMAYICYDLYRLIDDRYFIFQLAGKVPLFATLHPTNFESSQYTQQCLSEDMDFF